MKAFPNEFESAGMDLRDYFAAHAIQAKVTSMRSCDFQGDWPSKISYFAYEIADAMMEARKK